MFSPAVVVVKSTAMSWRVAVKIHVPIGYLEQEAVADEWAGLGQTQRINMMAGTNRRYHISKYSLLYDG